LAHEALQQKRLENSSEWAQPLTTLSSGHDNCSPGNHGTRLENGLRHSPTGLRIVAAGW
jgi:hypothetical protein